MTSVDIVTHAWSGPNAQYARLLAWQIRSLIEYPPRCNARLEIFSCPDDQPTVDVIERGIAAGAPIAVSWRTRPYLLQRPIGRNQAAISTRADVVIFADCDYLYGPGCLDSLAQVLDRPERLFFPRQTLISRDHATGDAYLARDPADGIDPADFIPKIERKAIGGIQIVRGETAREHGYCGHLAKYQRPAPDDCQTIIGFGADSAYRWQMETPGTPIDVPNLYRLRHSVTGDDRAERAGIISA